MKLILVLILAVIILFNLACSTNQISLAKLDQIDCRYTFRIGTNIGATGYAMAGHYYPIYIFLDSIGQAPLRGFNLTIAYNPQLLYLGSVGPAGALDCWENFEYEISPLYSEYLQTNLNLINIAASTTADFKLKDNPECEGESGYFERVPIRLVRLNFLVRADEDLYFRPFIPIHFYWQDCESNIINAGNPQAKIVCDNVTPIREFLPEKYNSYFTVSENTIPDNHLMGISDSCYRDAVSNDISVRRSVDFINGGVYVETHEPSFDIAGDLDLDNIACFYNDVFLYEDYFIYGDTVFTIDKEKQYLASDVNRDKIVLTLADFVYLVRVMKGDAVAFTKLHHLENSASLYMQNDTLFVESTADLGAVYLSVHGNPESVILLDSLVEKSDYVEGCRNYLIYAQDALNAIPAGRVPLLRFDTDSIAIIYFDAAGYYGDIFNATIKQRN